VPDIQYRCNLVIFRTHTHTCPTALYGPLIGQRGRTFSGSAQSELISSEIQLPTPTAVARGGGGKVFTGVCHLSVCRFPRNIPKPNAPRITKRDTETFHHESFLKIHLFWGQKVKGQGPESQKHCRRGSLHSCECWLFSSYFLWTTLNCSATSASAR